MIGPLSGGPCLNIMVEYLKAGTITQPFGIKGEMKVYPHTDDPARFKKLKKIYIVSKNGYDMYEVESAKMALPLVIIKLKGFDTPEQVRLLRQKDIYVSREDGAPLNEGEYYYADILGLNVIDDEGVQRGTITDILETGANDVYEITAEDGTKFLLPAIKECILSVDIESSLMKIHIPEGLLD